MTRYTYTISFLLCLFVYKAQAEEIEHNNGITNGITNGNGNGIETSVALIKWGNQLDDIAALLADLTQRVPTAVKQKIKDPTLDDWLHKTVTSLRNWRKATEPHLHTAQDVARALYSTQQFLALLKGILDKKCTVLPEIDWDILAKNVPESLPNLEVLYRAIDDDIDSISIVMQELTLMWFHRAARLIDLFFEQVEEKTSISTWWMFSPSLLGLPTLLARVPQPDRIHEAIKQYIYGGEIPHITIGSVSYKSWSIPWPKLDAASFKRWGRVEQLVERLLPLLILSGLADMVVDHFLGHDVIKLLQPIPEQISNLWSRLRGYRSRSRSQYEVITGIDFNDENIIGLEEQKAQLRDIVSYMLDPDKYTNQGYILQKGILLMGPSRTGKTLIARALAGTINKQLQKLGKAGRVTFIEVRLQDITSDAQFLHIIEDVQKHAPCILFIDELHMHHLQTTGNVHLLKYLLTAINDLYISNDPKNQIFILAATNRPDLIAKELRSHQRFGKEIRFNLPNAQQRGKFFELKLIKQLMLDAEQLKLSSYIRQTAGCNYGQLDSIVEVAKLIAKTDPESKTGKALKHIHVQKAIDQEVHHFVKDSHLRLTDDERRRLAVYQAGHALLHCILKPKAELEFVTIRGYYKPIIEVLETQRVKGEYQPDDQFVIEYGKLINYDPYESLKIADTSDLEKQVKIVLAGHSAQAIMFGSPSYSYHVDDPKNAWQLLKKCFPRIGYECPEEFIAEECPVAAWLLNRMVELEEETEAILMNHAQALDDLANALYEKVTLTANDVAAIIDTSYTTILQAVTTSPDALVNPFNPYIYSPNSEHLEFKMLAS